ncbi:DUF771 domain-containing protein [Aerococcus kribbianus]|uniref:DUF771 domain-containing protein n=1 Tax=Aerococcus kribbianus TaxID=2999064 RepID=A0A9X3JFN5_9LACT|nr:MULTISPECIES: DUF771 domain-containing protein [unclassified Aerococcus]MCZ0717859.1 DUF771 domain-containing protein [Aerococcus sp. YH-aer221]MCZ0726146.1 DUF771 domain-containing protein [Aerococcus sp. YH-aer222]
MTIGEALESAINTQIELINRQHEQELEKLKSNLDYGSYGDLKWFSDRVSMSPNKAKESILYPFRKDLEGKMVKYPESKGVRWMFNKYFVNKWLAENFERVLGE